MPCNLKQIVCLTGPVRSTELCILENKKEICDYKLSYSVDCINWSEWMKPEDILLYTTLLDSDYFLRVELYGNPDTVTVDGEEFEFQTSLAPSFDFTVNVSENLYNPYANLDCAMSLYQQLSENVSNIVGIPCYYFKVSPEAGSKDVTFKEYCHLNVTSVKFIKIIVADGKMPSSKPVFDDLGLSWDVDWGTEISKATFATAFGNTAQPMEGDLVYIPMMKRMWQVSSAYEEKSEGFMWNNTTFNVYLRKYEIQESISTGNFEETINSIVKNTYEDLFGDTVLGTNEETFTAPMTAEAADSLYHIYETDAYRKSLSINTLRITEDPAYHKGVLLTDNWYTGNGFVVYQKTYCGSAGTISFMLQNLEGSSDILTCGNLKVSKQENLLQFGDLKIDLYKGTFLCYFKWSSDMQIIEGGAIELKLPDKIPPSKINPGVYYLDYANRITASCRYSIEYSVAEPSEIRLQSNDLDFIGAIKFFTSFEEIKYLVQQYPNCTSLLFNDTVRQILDKPGWPAYNNQYGQH